MKKLALISAFMAALVIYSEPTNVIKTNELQKIKPEDFRHIEWQSPEGTFNMTLKTNVDVLWLTLDQQGRQVGFMQTNMVLEIVRTNETNLLVLRSLGREEWPTQKRIAPR